MRSSSVKKNQQIQTIFKLQRVFACAAVALSTMGGLECALAAGMGSLIAYVTTSLYATIAFLPISAKGSVIWGQHCAAQLLRFLFSIAAFSMIFILHPAVRWSGLLFGYVLVSSAYWFSLRGKGKHLW